MPAVEAGGFDDAIDVVDDAGDDFRGLIVADFLKERRERGFVVGDEFVGGSGAVVEVDGGAGGVEQGFEPFDGAQYSSFVFIAQLLQAFAKLDVTRVVGFLAHFGEQADFELSRAFGLLGFAEDEDRLFVDEYFVKVGADAVDIGVLVDEANGIGAERLPDERA